MRVIYMGTPDFSVSVLEAIIQKGHSVVGVVTQEDKPKGRGRAMQFTPVKEAAIQHNIPVYQPAKVKNNAEFEEELRSLNPDIIVVAAYGQILPKSILDMAKYGCVNVHASLLPKYRGAAPIQWSIIDGEDVTGVTTMMMDVGLDTGDMLDKIQVAIEPDDTGGSLNHKLAKAGGRLIVETMDKLENGTAIRQKQDDSLSTYAKILDKSLGKIDFTKSADEIERLIRGLNPWPSAYTSLRDKTLKIWKSQVMISDEDYSNINPGQIAVIGKDYIGVKTGKNILSITELQMEGKKRMSTRDFLMGVKLEVGEKLGNNN